MLRGFFFSIGSNIAPERHVPQIVRLLTYTFGALCLSPVYRTAPHGMATANHFMNLIGYLETPLDAEALKGRFNGIEETLGRDRGDPRKKEKDRVADIDILCEVSLGAAPRPDQIPGEPYLQPLYLALATALRLIPQTGTAKPGVPLSVEGAKFGVESVRINRVLETGPGLTSTRLPPP